MTAEEIRIALRNRYNDARRYAIAEEVGLTTGYSHRRLDFMVLDCYASNGFRIDGIEIKVSRSDLRRELEDPEKHIAFFDVIDYFTLAAPKDVLDSMMAVIPPKWGILRVDDTGQTRHLRRPLRLRDECDQPVPRGFLASITRAIQSREPAARSLEEQYQKGRAAGQAEEKRQNGYKQDYVRKQYDRLEKLDKIERRFGLWGNDLEEKLAAFEAFQKLHVFGVVGQIERVKKTLEDLTKLLEGKT